jgi:DNA-binding transcriptional LysR family regulator
VGFTPNASRSTTICFAIFNLNAGVITLFYAAWNRSGQDKGKELFYLPLKENLPERQVYVVTNRALPVSIAARAFMDSIRALENVNKTLL